MSNALTTRPPGSVARGAVSAAASAVVPGLGQLINGESEKAIGVFVVWSVAGLSLLGMIPLIGSVVYLAGAATWVYGVADGYVTGKKKR